MKDIITIGIDQSLTGTGICGIINGKMFFSALVKSKKTEDGPMNEIKRISEIVDNILKTIEINSSLEIDLVAIEGISYMSKNTTSLSQLSGLSYMIRAELFKRGLKFVVVAPSSLKKFATGMGNAKKDLMMMETYKEWGVAITNDNICDSFCLGMLANYICDTPKKLSKHRKEVINLIEKQYEKK